MPRLIDLSNIQKEKRSKEKNYSTESIKDSSMDKEENIHLLVSILLKNKPDKVIYSLKEASELLGIGQEFLRRRVKSGKIKAVSFGDKPAINLFELARIISEGV